MKKLIILLLHALILVPAMVFAQTTVIQFIPFSGQLTIQCTGEPVFFEGQYLWIRHSTQAGDNYNASYSAHFQGVTGTNMITGEKYIYTGTRMERVNVSFANGRRLQKEIAQVNFIGTGKAANYTLHMVVSTTFDANGELRAYIQDARMECR